MNSLDEWFARRLGMMEGVTVQPNALTEKMLATAMPSAAPTMVFTSGVPGSGKTTMTAKLLAEPAQFDTPPAFMMFDAVMDAYDGYHADYAAHGMEAAFRNWELTARITGYGVLHKLIAKRANIVFEHSFSDYTHVDLLKAMKADTNYRLVYMPIDCPVELCLERIKVRDAHKPRHVPVTYITERAKLIAGLKPEYLALADTVVVIDNSGALRDRVTLAG